MGGGGAGRFITEKEGEAQQVLMLFQRIKLKVYGGGGGVEIKNRGSRS